jgi:hypothetical protein
MLLQSKKPQRGLFTFLSEGSNNPKSPYYSRKVRLSHRGNVVIGRGYHMGDLASHEIFRDLHSIGLSKRKADALSKGAKLMGKEAKAFAENFENDIFLTEDQEIQLFHQKYYRIEEELIKFIENSSKRYGYIFFDKVPIYQQDLLLDFYYAGDWNVKIQDILLTAIKKALDENNPRIFDMILMDIGFWINLGASEERVKQRCIYINEWKSFRGKS